MNFSEVLVPVRRWRPRGGAHGFGEIGEDIVEELDRELAEVLFVDDLEAGFFNQCGCLLARDLRKLVSSVSAQGTG